MGTREFDKLVGYLEYLEEEKKPKLGKRYQSIGSRVKSIRSLTELEALNLGDPDKKRSKIERLAEEIGLSPKQKAKKTGLRTMAEI